MFKTQNFCHIASNNRNQVKAGVFVYRTTDNLATVSASGYFNARIIDINLHDLIIHEKIDASDATKVERNVLCVTERTLENVGVTVIKSKWEGDIEQEIADLKTYVDNNFVKKDGSSIMTGPLKMRSGSMQGAIAPYWNGIGLFKLGSNNNVTLLASMDDSYGFLPANTNTYNLGSSAYKWKDAYVGRVITSVLNNGANISVPTTAGTLALKSDIGIGTANITNCITEIPQDIQLELAANGTLTLKADSKLYIPNGTNTFTPKTFASDVTRTAGIGMPCLEVALFDKSTLNFVQMFEIPLTKACSGSTDTLSGTPQHLWYDTTNNLIKYYGSDGTTNSYYASFPHAIVTGDNSKITNINQIFNGFGYIGSTIFTLPGVKGLIPNGRNADGTLKNTKASNTTVRIYTSTSAFNGVIGMNSSGEITCYTNLVYDSEGNYNYQSGARYGRLHAGTVIFGSGGKITSFSTKYAFHAVDYSDYQKTVEQVETNTANIALKQDEATAVNYDNITNCITEIPQDIKLELSNNMVTLSAGSKLYYPNGTSVVTTSTTYFSGSPTYGKCFVFYTGISLGFNLVNNTFSGSTAPTGLTSGVRYVWLDTSVTPNVIKVTVNAGSTWTTIDDSLPLGIVTTEYSGGSMIVKSINQVFNGLGYIGSTIFALPGLKVLAPNGRNADGSLKNNPWKSSVVLTRTDTTNGTINVAINTITGVFGLGNYIYNEVENVNYYGGDVSDRRCIVGNLTISSGKITSFETKTAFHAVDYSDSDWGAHQAMPSNRYVNLTLPTSGNTITAPADGYLAISKSTDAVGQYLVLYNTAKAMRVSSYTPVSGYIVNCVLPVSKGDVVSVSYSAGGNTAFCVFVYANGAK